MFLCHSLIPMCLLDHADCMDESKFGHSQDKTSPKSKIITGRYFPLVQFVHKIELFTQPR